ncbi:MAG: carbohydrate kinase family protein [Trueperaceae bacterium]
MNIISLGEALIDFKAKDHLLFQGYEGGSPMNVAIASARLGGEVGFAGQVSNDLFGRALRDYLKKNKVDTTYLLEHSAPSTLAFVAEIDGQAHFTFISNGAANTLYNPQPRPTFPNTLRFLQFGSISLLTEPTSGSILDIVKQHRDRVTIVLDPNVRPALTADKAAYMNSLESWIGLTHILKVSSQDLDWLYPNKPYEKAANQYLDLGVPIVLVTDGDKGVTLYRKNQPLFYVAAPNVNVVDTVGAGDTFTGSLMVALLEYKDLTLSNDDWQKVLSFATHAAAFNCTRAGANPPTAKELQEFMKSRSV